MSAPFTDEQAQQIEGALYSGNKILAIKLHREFTGEGLKESKDFIEALERDLRRESQERFVRPSGRAGCLGVIAAFVGLFLIID